MSQKLRRRSGIQRTELLVKDVMTRNVITISDSASIDEAARIMRKSGAGCLAVERTSQIVGIITERDCIKALASRQLETLQVKDVMSTPIVTIGPNDTLSKAVSILAEKKMQRLPIMDGAHIVGILTSADLARYYDKLSRYSIRTVGP